MSETHSIFKNHQRSSGHSSSQPGCQGQCSKNKNNTADPAEMSLPRIELRSENETRNYYRQDKISSFCNFCRFPTEDIETSFQLTRDEALEQRYSLPLFGMDIHLWEAVLGYMEVQRRVPAKDRRPKLAQLLDRSGGEMGRGTRGLLMPMCAPSCSSSSSRNSAATVCAAEGPIALGTSAAITVGFGNSGKVLQSY